MLSFNSWEEISTTDSGPLLLSVDRPGDWCGAAGLADFARLIGEGYRVLRLNPGRDRAVGRPLSAASCTDLWCAGLRDGPPVAAVLGHGVGGVYAAEIAEAVARWQLPPVVILFDPEVASAGLLARTLAAALAADHALLSAAEIDRTQSLVAELAARPEADAGLADTIVGAYLEILSTPWERNGLGDIRDSEFTRSFESRVSWLAATARLDPSQTWQRSTAIISNEYPHLAGTETTGTGTTVAEGTVADVRSLVGRQIMVDVARDGLLRSALVARAVLTLLEERRAHAG